MKKLVLTVVFPYESEQWLLDNIKQAGYSIAAEAEKIIAHPEDYREKLEDFS